MNSDEIKPDAMFSNFYLKINEQKLGPVTKQEIMELLNQKIVLKTDMVSHGTGGPWMEIRASNIEMELLLPTFDVRPAKLASIPLTRAIPSVVSAKQSVAMQISYPAIKTIPSPKPNQKWLSKGVNWYLLVGLMFLVGCGGIWWLWIFVKAFAFHSIPNKNYSKEWKNDRFPYPQSIKNLGLNSIDVWDQSSIFISGKDKFDEIHYWNGKEWRLLHKTSGYNINLSEVKAIGPDQVIAVSKGRGKPVWVISNPKGTKIVDFNGESPSDYEIKNGRPTLGKNGEFIFQTNDKNYLFKDSTVKKINGDEFVNYFFKDPIFANFYLEAEKEAHKEGYQSLFSDEKLGMAGFSKGTEVLIIEQKNRKKTSYQMVGETPQAWMAWARSITDFWVMSKDGTLRRTDGGLLKIISKLPHSSISFIAAALDRKTGNVYGVSQNAIWTLD